MGTAPRPEVARVMVMITPRTAMAIMLPAAPRSMERRRSLRSSWRKALTMSVVSGHGEEGLLEAGPLDGDLGQRDAGAHRGAVDLGCCVLASLDTNVACGDPGGVARGWDGGGA